MCIFVENSDFFNFTKYLYIDKKILWEYRNI